MRSSEPFRTNHSIWCMVLQAASILRTYVEFLSTVCPNFHDFRSRLTTCSPEALGLWWPWNSKSNVDETLHRTMVLTQVLTQVLTIVRLQISTLQPELSSNSLSATAANPIVVTCQHSASDDLLPTASFRPWRLPMSPNSCPLLPSQPCDTDALDIILDYYYIDLHSI